LRHGLEIGDDARAAVRSTSSSARNHDDSNRRHRDAVNVLDSPMIFAMRTNIIDRLNRARLTNPPWGVFADFDASSWTAKQQSVEKTLAGIYKTFKNRNE
jgi:hypothetical protein